ncbi:MAG TPA: hypothetical protein VN829_18380 [Dongiaceae bacterium]|nr:hypothetical protein [Dongiaceae bacterium]
MKTNQLGRQFASLHSLASFLAVLLILAVEISLGMSMVSRLGHTSSTRTPTPPEGLSVNVSGFEP